MVRSQMHPHPLRIIARALITLVVLHIPVGASATPSVLDLKKLNAEIDLQGACDTVGRLFENDSEWNALMRQVGTGDRRAIEVAFRLLPGSDGAASEMLHLSLGEALEHAESDVLTKAGDMDLQSICSGPDVDDERYNSLELSRAALDRRISAVSALQQPRLLSRRNECLQSLKAARANDSFFKNR